MKKLLIILAIFLSACSHKLIFIYESGEAIKQDIKIDASDSINATSKESLTVQESATPSINYWESK